MAQDQNLRRIIWAVDAFHPEDELQANTRHTVSALAQSCQATVEPVYVLSPEQLNLSADSNQPWIEKYRPAAEKSLVQMMGSWDIPGRLEPKVLVQPRASTTSAVKTLAVYAHSTASDLIAVATHGKSGVSRLLLGSFAESLLLYSKVPILTVGPDARPPETCRKILFPTDFGRRSKIVFNRVVLLARQLNASIVLLHVIPNPISPVLQTGIRAYYLSGGWLSTPDYLAKEQERRQRQAGLWAKRAQKLDVSVEVRVDTAANGVVSSILGAVERENVQMIAMAAQSGAFASAIVGSVTRQVVRTAPVPVWVVRSSSLGKASEK